MSIPIFFDWKVPKKGFQLIDGFDAKLHKSGDCFVTSEVTVLVPKTSKYRTYKPLDHDGLFQTFAATPETPEEVLAFSRKYGALGIHKENISFDKDNAEDILTKSLSASFYDGKAYIDYPAGEDPNWDEIGATGEPLNEWFKIIKYMRSMINLWNNTDKVGKDYVRWEGYDEVWFDLPSPAANTLIASKTTNPELLAELRPGDHIGPATAFLLMAISQRIEDAKPNMTILDGRPQVIIRPQSLLSVMWLQFSVAVTEEKQYRACEHCGTYFEVGAGKGRKTKKFCSESCRVMAFRNKKKIKDDK